jgi:WD40 repeat protein
MIMTSFGLRVRGLSCCGRVARISETNKRSIVANDFSSLVGAAILAAVRIVACFYSLGTTNAAEPVATLRGHEDMIMGLAFSPDGKLLASGSHDGTVRIWDVAKRSERNVLRGHADGHFVLSVAFSRDGKLVASSSSNKTVKLWEVANGKEQATLQGHSDGVETVAFSPTVDILASGAAAEVFIWNVPTRKRIANFQTSSTQGTKVAFSPDGKTVATGGFSKPIELWDMSTSSKRAVLEGQDAFKLALVYSPDGTTIVSSGTQATLVVWDVLAGKIRTHIKSAIRENSLSLAFLPDSRTIMASSVKGARSWDVNSGQELQFYPVRSGADAIVPSIAVSPNGETLAASDLVEVKLFELNPEK